MAISRLGSSNWVRRHQHLFLVGPTGIGKTFLALAFGQKACRDGFTATGAGRLVVDSGQVVTRQFKIIVEKHSDGYVAYPLGMKGIVVGEGDSYEEALADVKSAIRFHIETFGDEVLPNDSPPIEAFIAEATISA